MAVAATYSPACRPDPPFTVTLSAGSCYSGEWLRKEQKARADADVQRQRLQSLFMHSPAAVAMTFAAASESVFTSSARCSSRQQTPAPRLQPQDRVDLRAVRRDAL